METSLLKVEIRYEHDVVLARQRARQLAMLLGFESQDQVRIATAVSELARNAFQYAGEGKVEFLLVADESQKLLIRVQDNGPGIAHLKEILGGTYVSKTGMGLGLIGARKLMDDFFIEAERGKGTQIELAKKLPKKTPVLTKAAIGKLGEELHKLQPNGPFEEIQRQNQELLAALDEVQRQQKLLTQLNQELEETNRGVMALSGELEQRADFQQRSSELKTEFLSGITHELRTPINSIISISEMLLAELDGELTNEQEKQVTFIQSSARSLSEIVNDVLDMAKVEAGKINIRPRHFSVAEMFRILRGMLKPLIEQGSTVELVFDPCINLPWLFTDEGKVSQIMRNFISNSLKYTQKGEVTVSAALRDADTIVLSVRDTGIGIAKNYHEFIFEEYSQIEGDHQHKVRGTGLGLPLTRKLARLLGGEVSMTSKLNKGSIFELTLPIQYSGAGEGQYSERHGQSGGERFASVLIIDDNPADRYVLRKMLEPHAEQIAEASSGQEGLSMALSEQPTLIFLDLAMPDITGQEVLGRLKQATPTETIPVIIHTSSVLTDKERRDLNAATAILSKSSSQKSRLKELTEILAGLSHSHPIKAVSHG